MVSRGGREGLKKVIFRAEIFQENGLYVALCPGLNVSRFGDSPQEARHTLREASDFYLDELVKEDPNWRCLAGHAWELRRRGSGWKRRRSAYTLMDSRNLGWRDPKRDVGGPDEVQGSS